MRPKNERGLEPERVSKPRRLLYSGVVKNGLVLKCKDFRFITVIGENLAKEPERLHPRAKKSDLPKAGRCRWESGVPVQAALVPSGEVPLPWARVPQSMETPMTMSQTARK